MNKINYEQKPEWKPTAKLPELPKTNLQPIEIFPVKVNIDDKAALRNLLNPLGNPIDTAKDKS